MVTPGTRREIVAHSRVEHAVSERRACQALGADHSVVRYRARRGDDAVVRGRLRALASERRRFGYRRLGLLLSREGVVLNHKKLRRLYGQEKLQVRRRGGRKRALAARAPLVQAAAPNRRSSLDFVSDAVLACIKAAARRLRRCPSASLDPGCARRPGSCGRDGEAALDRTEKHRHDGVAMNQGSTFEWRGVGAQVNREKR